MATKMEVNVAVKNPFGGMDDFVTLHGVATSERLDKAFSMLRVEKAWMIYLADTISGENYRIVKLNDDEVEFHIIHAPNSQDTEIKTFRAAKAAVKKDIIEW